jgi:hypothetical protein
VLSSISFRRLRVFQRFDQTYGGDLIEIESQCQNLFCPFFNLSCRFRTNFGRLRRDAQAVLAFAPGGGRGLTVRPGMGLYPHLFSKRKNLTRRCPLLCHTAEYATSTADADLE